MCFSAEASFGAAALLLPMGGWCVYRAATRMPAWTGFALLPIGFGLQQFSEGLVWLGLERGWDQLVTPAATIYLFFALAFWPIWIPVSAIMAERSARRRRWLGIWLGLGMIWLVLFYGRLLLLMPDSLTACICGNSIQYAYADLNVFVPGGFRWSGTLLYILCTGAPLLTMSRWRQFLVPWAGGAMAVILAALFYSATFTSVWCFFAALVSSYCVYFFATQADVGRVTESDKVQQSFSGSGITQKRTLQN